MTKHEFISQRSVGARPPSRMPDRGGLLQRKCACGSLPRAVGECIECAKHLQCKIRHSGLETRNDSSVPPIIHEVLRSPGEPLDADTRAFMEPRFGHDFSHVQLHTGARAAESAGAVNALAYTVGHDVVFGSQQFSPQSTRGRMLLAHELTHVLQQASGESGADAESKARESSKRVLRGESIDARAVGSSPLALQKADDGDSLGSSLDTPTSAPTNDSTEPPIDEFEFDKSDVPSQHLARLAELRTRLINAPKASVVLTGHTDTVGTERYNVDLGKRRAAAVRDRLTSQDGVSSSRIEIASRGEREPAAGQPPAKLDPRKGDKNPKNRRVEVRTAGLPAAKGWSLDLTDPTKKKVDLNLPRTYVPDSSTPKSRDERAPSSSAAPNEKSGPEVEASAVLDPKAKSEPGSTRTSRAVEATVELSWEAKSGPGKRLRSKIGFTLHVGPNGLEEVEVDLTVFRKKIKDVALGGTVRDLTFSLGLNAGLNLDKSTANGLVSEFSEKAKAALEADLVIPKTSIAIPVEVSGSVDLHGKPEWEIKVTLFKW